MKSKFKITIALLVLSTLLVSAAGADYTKQYKKSWTKSSVSSLKITNKFGEVKINDTGGDSVSIKVLITIDNQSSSKAKELMDKIHIDFQKSGNLVIAETTIEDKFNSNGSFSIDYLVNIPKDRDLDITNRYGNVVLNDLDAKGTFNVSYGSMSAGNLKSPAGNPIAIVINYGKADLESVNDAKMEFKYSKLFVGEIDKLIMDSKYCTVNIDEISAITLTSKYDAVNIDNLGKLKSESRYTNYKIGNLSGSLDLNTGYGSVQINQVESQFEKIAITNSYGGINIGMNGLNYKLIADCDYCDVKYPTERYKGNKIKESHRFSLDGQVGHGGGTVSITSRYGGVKLTE
ncbi:MAG: hypothetical protein WAO52_05615 [Prolixibacteraceae bacterium]